MPQLVRRLAALMVAFTLALPLSAGVLPDLASHRAESSAPGLLGQLWGWLTGAWAEVGCSIDPNGQTCTTPQVDEGCSIDPNGRTCVTPQVDEGCSIDPGGRPCPGVQ